MLTFGLVVEGEYDEASLPEFIRNCISAEVHFVIRKWGQKGKFHRGFPVSLEEFRHAKPDGTHVDRALVVRDANNNNPDELESRYLAQIRNRTYPFLVKFHFIVHELETWLLADEVAISKVTQLRSGGIIQRVQDVLESIIDPKERLRRILAGAGVPYTQEVARLIATESNLETVEYRCPRFKKFREILTDD